MNTKHFSVYFDFFAYFHISVEIVKDSIVFVS